MKIPIRALGEVRETLRVRVRIPYTVSANTPYGVSKSIDPYKGRRQQAAGSRPIRN